MIKSCVIGLSKVGIIHCESILKIKNTSSVFWFLHSQGPDEIHVTTISTNDEKSLLVRFIELLYSVIEVVLVYSM